MLLAARAAHILGHNADGDVVKPARALYPHQWSWDTAFIAIGLAAIDLELACRNLDALFRGQWRNGMVPHIVFDANAEGYFPGPDRWACAELTAEAPRSPLTSGICQPPVHAIAAWRIVQAGMRQGPAASGAASAWAARSFPKLLAWHRFLQRERVDEATGLVQIFHGWESGMDNSPRFDRPYSHVRVGADLPPYQRRDLSHVADAAQRPTNEEYDRYLWLVEEAKHAHYDQGTLRKSCSFRVGDVFFTALFAAANDHLADLADHLGLSEGAELRGFAAAARAAVQQRADATTGLATDIDLRSGEDLATGTVAGFAPLLAGDVPALLRERTLATLLGPCWAGNGTLRWPLPPSTSPCSESFRPRTYWRGPVWPVVNWLIVWALERAGETERAGSLRRAALDQLATGGFAEYYEPGTGEPLGSANHSWTAAVIVDWLCS